MESEIITPQLSKRGRPKKIKSLEEILIQKQKTALYQKKHRQTQEHKQKRKSQKSYQTDYRRCNYKNSHIYTKWYTILSGYVKSSNKKRHKIETDFDSKYIKELFDKQNGLCAYFKIPLVITKTKKHPFKPSIDRIDNNKGYTKDNIVLCCLMANMGRNSCSYEEWMKCLDELEIKKKCSV